MDTYIAYIEQFAKSKLALIQEMEEYAALHHIPIMDDQTIESFLGLLQLQNPTEILEIGSAIGYSAIRMAQTLPEVNIITIEREQSRYEDALRFIERAEVQDRVGIINADALEMDTKDFQKGQFDALFIDAAKGQYQRFFEMYEPFVRQGGFIYCDNMFMRDLVVGELSGVPRRKRTMVRNLKKFTQWITENQAYESTLFPLGDGILIAKKK